MSTTVLAVFGATGVQGSPIIRQARDAGFRVRALVRDPRRLATSVDDAVVGDIDQRDAVRRVLEGANAASIHLPIDFDPDRASTRMDTLLDAARLAGVTRLIYNVAGPVPASPTGLVALDLNLKRVHTLRSFSTESVVFVPQLYLDNMLAPWFLAAIAAGVLAYPPLPPQFAAGWTSTGDFARLTVAAAADRTRPGGVFDAVASRDTGTSIAAALQSARGHDVRFTPPTLEQFTQGLAQAVGPRDAEAIAGFYTWMMMNDAKPFAVTDSAFRAFGVAPVTAAAWIKSQGALIAPSRQQS